MLNISGYAPLLEIYN